MALLPTKKITALPPFTPPLTGDELFEAVQLGNSVQVPSRAFVLPTDALLTFASIAGNLPGSRQLIPGTGIQIELVDPNAVQISMLGTGALPADPTSAIGLTVVPGVAATWMRSDAAPPLDVTISPVWTGRHTFTQLVAGITGGIVLDSANPGIVFIENDAAAANRVWDIVAAGEQLRGRVKTDDGLTVGNWFVVDRTNNTIDAIAWTATSMTLNGIAMVNLASTPTWTGVHTFTAGNSPNNPSIRLQSNRPVLDWIESDASADNGRWYFDAQGEALRFAARNDAGDTSAIFMQVDRTGMTLDDILMGCRVTSPRTAFTVAGAAQALDLRAGSDFHLTLQNNVTISFTNPPASGRGYTFTIMLLQDATGSRTVTWPASVHWSDGLTPVLTTTANRLDAVTLTTYDGGTTYYGGQVLANVVP